MGGFLSASEVAVSSAAAKSAARQIEPISPWATSFGYDQRGTRVDLRYRIRWDIDDAIHSPRSIGETLSNPGRSLEWGAWGLMQGWRLELYGARLRPFRAMRAPRLIEDSPPSAPSPLRADGGLGEVLRPRRNLELAIDDLGASARRELRHMAVRQGFDMAIPQARGAPYWQKDAAASGLMQAGDSWEVDWTD